jgi:hypothetical protein
MKGISFMSIAGDMLITATFPDEYADLLRQTLGIEPSNFLSVKDALFHFRRLDDGQAAEVIRRIAESFTGEAD